MGSAQISRSVGISLPHTAKARYPSVSKSKGTEATMEFRPHGLVPDLEAGAKIEASRFSSGDDYDYGITGGGKKQQINFMKMYILINLISLTFCFGQNPIEAKDAVHHVEWEYRYPDDGEGGGAVFGPVATSYFFDGKKLGEGKDGIEALLVKLNRCEKDKVIFYLSTRKRRGEGKVESGNFPRLFSAGWTRVLWAARNRSLEIVCKNKLKDGASEK